jgi:hypothetical protein
MNPRRHLTYANVMATIAVFVALGGSSYAALRVTGKQVADRSLTGRDVKTGSLTSRQIKDRSLRAKDFRAGQLPAGVQGPQGIAGPQGPDGPKGEKGDTGAKGDAGEVGPTYGQTISRFSASVNGCGLTTLLELPVTVTRPARILALGAGAWSAGSTNLNSGSLTASLLLDDAVVARSALGYASDEDADEHRLTMSVNAVLYQGASSLPATPTAYVAQPGAYTLRLEGGASDGTCAGTSTVWRPQLTYVLLGTTP